MFNNLLNRGGCMIGMHQGEWEYLADKSCEQKRICTVCETEQTRTEHQMGEWTTDPSQPCTQMSTCERCGTTESEVTHTWDKWEYVADDSCTAHQVCSQCGAKSEETTEQHVWGKWAYNEGYRSPLRTCTRCQTQMVSFAVAAEVAPASTTPSTEESNPVVNDILSSIDALNALSEAKDGAVDDEMQSAVDGLVSQLIGAFSAGENAQTAEPEPAQTEETATDYAEAFGALMQSYQDQIAGGQLSAEDQAKFGSLLSELGDVVTAKPDDMLGMLERSGKMRELMGRLADASDEKVPHDLNTRLGAVTNYFFILDRLIKKEAASPNWSSSDHEDLQNLFKRVIDAKNTLVGLTTDTDAYAHERQNLRKVAYDVRQYFNRQHLGVAKPIWTATALPVNPNQIYFAGQASHRSLIESICEDRQLDLLAEPQQKDPAQARWDQIRACHVAVFDMTQYDREQETDLTLTTQVAEVAYDMGIAFVLGKPMVVLAQVEQNLPFDIDIEPVRLAKDAKAQIGQALDDALYTLQRGGGESSVKTTVNYLQQRFSDHPDSMVGTLFKQFDEDVLRSAGQTRRIVGQLLALIGDDAPQIISPTFPLSYPDESQSRCFHVTAFRDWAKRPSTLIEAACQASNTTYRRGDQALDPDIIRSIWDEICVATHIVVDLTHLNANAVLEMGMAHTLGRKVLAISQDQDIHLYFRSIQKLRIHQYEVGNAASEQQLSQILQSFLTT